MSLLKITPHPPEVNPMRRLLLAVSMVVVTGFAGAQDKKGTSIDLAGMKSTTPAEWKEETPSNNMRMAQFKLLKAEGDTDDAELAFFVFPGGSGTVKANLDRQLAKFVEEGRKDKVEKTKIGEIEATYQDVNGTFKKKKFPMAPLISNFNSSFNDLKSVCDKVNFCDKSYIKPSILSLKIPTS